MGEEQEVLSPEQQQQGTETEQNGQGIHPAWNDLLQKIPQELHGEVTPYLQDWNKGVQDKIQKIHSEYEPWKPFIQKGYDPERLEYGAQVIDALENNPEEVYKALGEYYQLNGNGNEPAPVGGGQDSEQGPPGLDDEVNSPYRKELDELRHQSDTMAQIILEQRRVEQEKQAEAQLDSQLKDLHKKYGDFNEKLVLGLALDKNDDNVNLEEVVKEYQGYLKAEVEKANQGARLKPVIMGSGGGVPNQTPDVRKMSDKETKSLVAEYLRAAAEQNR